jgi:hypothetical protein
MDEYHVSQTAYANSVDVDRSVSKHIPDRTRNQSIYGQENCGADVGWAIPP